MGLESNANSLSICNHVPYDVSALTDIHSEIIEILDANEHRNTVELEEVVEVNLIPFFSH